MKIVSFKTQVAKRVHVCSCCGGSIGVGDAYTYTTYRVRREIGHHKCHTNCYLVADCLGLFELDCLTTHTFIKRLVDSIIDAHNRGGVNVKRKTVMSYPVSHLTDIFLKYRIEKDAVSSSSSSGEASDVVVRECISLYVSLFMMPNMMDDLIYDLQGLSLYKHKTKKVINDVLREFESMSRSLFNLYKGKASLVEAMNEASMTIYDSILGDISIKGLDKSANILISMIDSIRSKYIVIGSEQKVSENIRQIDVLKKKLVDCLKYNEQEFIKLIVDKHNSSADIVLVK